MTITLADALTLGQGVERPFNCPKHDDHNASASVNVFLGVWVCYACHAAGRVTGKSAPSAEALAAMLHPDKATRVYPESYLEHFDDEESYWTSRFPLWCCRAVGFGSDPLSGDPCFPVRLADGRCAGVGRRRTNDDGEKEYRYPRGWSASRSLGGYPAPWRSRAVAVVEGYADRAALIQMGVLTVCTWGAGLHHPQLELLRRLDPALLLSGFDADDAGNAAHERLLAQVPDIPALRLNWAAAGAKDPAELDGLTRLEVCLATVGAEGYGDAHHQLRPEWSTRSAHLRLANGG